MSMVLGLSGVGVSASVYTIDAILNSIDTTSVVFYGGNEGVVLDSVWGINQTITDSQYQDYVNEYNPIFNSSTYMLAKFDQDIFSAGSIAADDASTITGYSLYRIEVETGEYRHIQDFGVGQNVLKDFTALKDKNYQYVLFVKGKNEDGSDTMSAAILTDSILYDYSGYYIVDVENNISYRIDAALSGGSMDFSMNINEFKINQKYNLYYKSKNFYITGNVSGIIYENNTLVDGENTDNILIKFKEFAKSSRPKYLKTKKGEIFSIIITNYTETPLSVNSSNNTMVSNITFKESGDVF